MHACAEEQLCCRSTQLFERLGSAHRITHERLSAFSQFPNHIWNAATTTTYQALLLKQQPHDFLLTLATICLILCSVWIKSDTSSSPPWVAPRHTAKTTRHVTRRPFWGASHTAGSLPGPGLPTNYYFLFFFFVKKNNWFAWRESNDHFKHHSLPFLPATP